jgi:hypothetical protein
LENDTATEPNAPDADREYRFDGVYSLRDILESDWYVSRANWARAPVVSRAFFLSVIVGSLYYALSHVLWWCGPMWLAMYVGTMVAGAARRLRNMGPTRRIRAAMTSSGVLVEWDSWTNAYSWDAVTEILDRPRHILILIASVALVILPKRALLSRADGDTRSGSAMIDLWQGNKRVPAPRWGGCEFAAGDLTVNRDSAVSAAYRIALNDVKAFNVVILSARHKLGLIRRRIALAIAVATFLVESAASWLALALRARVPMAVWAPGYIAMQLVLLLFLSAICLVVWRDRVAIFLARLPKTILDDERVARFDTNGCSERTGELFETRVPWSAVTDVIEDPERIYIIVNHGRSGTVIPRSAFASTADAQAFARTIRGLWRRDTQSLLEGNPW